MYFKSILHATVCVCVYVCVRVTWLTSPWCEDGVVQEVLKHFAVGGVGGLGLQVLSRLGAGAAGPWIPPAGSGLAGLESSSWSPTAFAAIRMGTFSSMEEEEERPCMSTFLCVYRACTELHACVCYL